MVTSGLDATRLPTCSLIVLQAHRHLDSQPSVTSDILVSDAKLVV